MYCRNIYYCMNIFWYNNFPNFSYFYQDDSYANLLDYNIPWQVFSPYFDNILILVNRVVTKKRFSFGALYIFTFFSVSTLSRSRLALLCARLLFASLRAFRTFPILGDFALELSIIFALYIDKYPQKWTCMLQFKHHLQRRLKTSIEDSVEVDNSRLTCQL